MKRAILAVLASMMVFGVMFGFAASLVVDAGNLQSGGDTDLDCDDEIQVSWNIEWDNAVDEYVVGVVRIGGLNSACNGSDIVVTLTAFNGNFLAQRTTHDVVDDPAPSVDFKTGDNSPVEVPDVFDVHVAIINASSHH